MNRREMIKLAYQAPPKNEVVDEIDKLFKAAAPADWESLLMSDKGIASAMNKLPKAVRGPAIAAMASGVSHPDALSGALGPVGIKALQAGGYLPSQTPVGAGQKALGIAGKALTSAAPIMIAGAGLYGISGLLNYVKEKSKANKFESAKSDAFEKLLKDPELSGVDKKKLKQVFDLYADVSPLVTEHPILASSVMKEIGGVDNAANLSTLKNLGDLYNAKQRAIAEVAKTQTLGWSGVSSDPSKIRSLIGER